MATSVRTTMMLGNLSVGAWSARIKADAVSRKAEADSGAKAGTVSAAKKLMAGVAELDAVQKAATMHRNWWADKSVDWIGSLRGYNAGIHMDLLVEIGDRRRDYMGLVSTFTSLYPNLRAMRQYDMGSLFNDKEFPTPPEVERKFHFEFEHMNLPDAEDIRIMDALPQEEIDRLVAAQVAQENAKVRAGMRIAAERLQIVVAAMHNKLSVKIGDSGHIFRDSLIENIVELVDTVMPGLNIVNDPDIDKLCRQAKKLTLYSPDELREDETKRAKAAAEAKALAGKLSSLFT